MKQTTPHTIQWYEPEDNRRKPCATMKTDGTLCFGLIMQEEFKEKIRIGFLENENAIIVEKDAEKGSTLPLNGQVKLTKMAKQMLRAGLTLPLYFLFDEEKKGLRWRGYIVPPFRKIRCAKSKKVKLSTDHMWLLNAYKWITDKAVQLYAKSTPLEERRAAADEALLEALCEYTPVYGMLKEYLWERMKERLLEQNKLYTGILRYNSVSIDASVKPGDESGGTRHELLTVSATNEINDIEDKLDYDIFSSTFLNEQEKQIFNMLLNGHTAEEIKRKFQLTEPELTLLCTKIGERWRNFSVLKVAI